MASLSFGIKRKVFYVDDDKDRPIYLDTGDFGIIQRWEGMKDWIDDIAKKLEEIGQKAGDPNMDAALVDDLAGQTTQIDKELHAKLNYLFDTDVCTPILGNASLIRWVDGVPLFVVIIETLLPLYEADIKKNVERSAKRISKHTAKYVGGEVSGNAEPVHAADND